MRLKKLREKRNDLQAQMNSLLETATTEERAMTAEEAASFDAAEQEIKNIDETIRREERARNLALETEKTAEARENRAAEDEKKTAEAEERAFSNYVMGSGAPENRAQLTNGDNGDIIPRRIADRIITAVRDIVPFMQLADVIHTSGELAVPVYSEDDTNYIQADYMVEGTDVSDNVGKFTTINLKGYALNALALVSKKLQNNTDINVTDFVVKQLSEALAYKLEKEFVIGTEGKITGITSAKKGIPAAAATAITYDELVKLKHSLKQRFRRKAVFIMHPDTYTYICTLKDEVGNPYFKEDEYKILNVPVIESDSMPTMESGAKAIVIADLSGYTIKATTEVEIQILREKFATKGFIGILGYCDFDGKITDDKKVRVLTMG